MAKKIKRVVVPLAYLEMLEGKEDLLDELFSESCTVRVYPESFKQYGRLAKIADKIPDTTVEPYEEPKKAK